MYQLPTAPLNIGGILDDGFRLFRAAWWRLLPIALVASAISAIPQFLIAGLTEIKPGEAPPGLALGAGTVVTIVIVVLLTYIAYAVMLAGVDRAARLGEPSLREAVTVGLRRAPAFIGAAILVALAIVLGIVLLIVPGIYLMVALFPVFILPVAERLGPVQSIRRSLAMVKGAWWRTAGILTVMGILLIALFAMVSVVTGFAVAPFIDVESPQAAMGELAVVQFVAALIIAPLLPLSYCIMYAVYTDLRLRKDGGDLVGRVAAARA